MPTVPPTCVSLDPLTSIPLPESDFFSGDGSVGGPTPDPDNDDVMLVQPDSGMITQDTPSQCPPLAIAKPHNVDPSSLILHSPSSIVGTPFESSPRFEYPFPPAAAAPADIIQELQPIVSYFHLSSPMPAFSSVVPPVPGSGAPLATNAAPSTKTKSRAETRNFSPTHPKLQARDPPVPPGLKYKLHQNGTGSAATIKIHGFDITSLTLPQQPGVGRARGVSLSTLLDKHTHVPLGEEEARNSRSEAVSVSVSVTNAGGIGEKQARVANKWKRHTLARCERDREFVLDGSGGAKRECSSVVDVLGGRPTRVATRPLIPYVPPAAVPSHRPA